MRSHSMLSVVFVFVAGNFVSAEDWPRFRGANGAGVSLSEGLPAEFNAKNDTQEIVGFRTAKVRIARSEEPHFFVVTQCCHH